METALCLIAAGFYIAGGIGLGAAVCDDLRDRPSAQEWAAMALWPFVLFGVLVMAFAESRGR